MSVFSKIYSITPVSLLKPLSLAAMMVFVTACDDDNKSNGKKTLAVPFMLHSGQTHLSCDTEFSDLGSGDRTGSLSKFRMFVSDIQVKDENGEAVAFELDENVYQTDGVALIEMVCGDIERTNLSITGSYNGNIEAASVSFTIGVPTALNHADPSSQTAPINDADMQWPWLAGKRFMVVEGVFNDVARATENRIVSPTYSVGSFKFHLGSVSCTADPDAPINSDNYDAADVNCDNENRPEIAFDDVDLAMQAVKIDLNNLFGDTDFELSSTCHSSNADTKQLCMEAFDALGLDYTDGTSDASSQTAFTVTMNHGS